MKVKLITQLIVGALAGVAAAGAYAGQIQSSSVSIAREVIINDTQAIDSPAVSYRFAGDVNASVQTQTFQVQLTLSAGVWKTAGDAASINIVDGVTAQAWTQNAVSGLNTYQVVAQGLSSDKKTLWVTIQVDQFAAKLLKQPLVTFSAAAVKPTITKLFSIVQEIENCDVAVKSAKVNVSHFVGLSSPGEMAVNGTNGVADEHVRAGSTNEGTLLVFPTNILVKWTPATGDAKIDVAASQTKFTGNVVAGKSYLSPTLAYLGKVELKQNAEGYDIDLANRHLLSGGATTGLADGIDEKATAALKTGEVEAKTFDVVITPSDKFAVGSALSLNTQADCAGTELVTSGALTSTTAAGAVTIKVPTTADKLGFGANGLGPVHVCYTVNGTDVIPGSSFTVTGQLTKADGAALAEQNNFCNGTLYPLGGSVKIDVRNYFNSTDSTWASQIRLINPDETRTIDVYAQLIQGNGKYGPWGKIATLGPREAKNMLAAEIDPLLTSAPAHATSSNNGDSTVQKTEGAGARLRITSPNAQTLRVQNYLYNKNDPSKFLEASGSQAVDFAGTTDRAPANEGQYQSQDAWKGLNGSN